MSLLQTAPMRTLGDGLEQILTLQNLLGTLLLLVLGYLLLALFGQYVGKRLMQFFRLRNILQRAVIGLGIGLVGWLLPMLHLVLFDRLFLKIGRLRRPDNGLD